MLDLFLDPAADFANAASSPRRLHGPVVGPAASAAAAAANGAAKGADF